MSATMIDQYAYNLRKMRQCVRLARQCARYARQTALGDRQTYQRIAREAVQDAREYKAKLCKS